jgi:hypothetical protein
VSGCEVLLSVWRPKLVSETMPHSSCAVTRVRSQSGAKLPFKSVHVRVTNSARLETGSRAPFWNPTCEPSACRYLLTPSLSAVFRVPNRS